MNKSQAQRLVKDTLIDFGYYSKSAMNLLLGTFAQESHLFEYIEQISGPALGGGQMEPFTFWDHYNNYLTYTDDEGNHYTTSKAKRIEQVANIGEWNEQLLKHNLKFAICMTRVHYLRVKEPLPNADDIERLARYWKQHYNTYLGRGTEQEFIKNYKKFAL